MILGAVIRLKDQFSGTFSNLRRQTNTVSNKLRILGRMVVRPVVRVRDEATRQLSKIKSFLTSIQGMATIALGVVGLNKLSEATVGSAMNLESQMVSMEHWLKGNKKLAQETVGWLNQFAASTPFEMDDLFPSMTRAIGLGNGDVSQAKQMIKLAGDMAALTPGKTVQDAMEALADAQMGEFERMKEFSMKVTQENYKAWGGFAGFIKQAQGRFAGGAEKLSKTALGRISTITDNIKMLFQKAGVGILESLSPRLARITTWFDNNQQTVDRWKNNLVRFGREGTETLLSFFEKTFTHVRVTYLDNPEFTSLTFSGKIKFILNDISTQLNAWLDGGGSDQIKAFGARIGELIGEGLKSAAPAIGAAAGQAFLSAFTAGIKSSPLGAALIGAAGGAVVGSVIPGAGTAAGALAGAGSGIISWGASKLLGGGKKPKKKASGLPRVPYDNYPALLHRGEVVLPRRDADNNGQGQGKVIHISQLNINGLNKSIRQIFDEIMDIAEAEDMNMGQVVFAD